MERTFLTIKLRIPAAPQHLMHRARLLDTLTREIPLHKVTVVTSPAGYGKTTLLADWARSAEIPVVWLSLSEDDNDPDRFLRYLLSGWESAAPGVVTSPFGLLLSSSAPEREAVLSAFINAASVRAEGMAFVLDDFHLVSDSTIHQALGFLLDHLPPSIHLVLATREQPPLPLARYRARQELFELQTRDLQFLPDESAYYLSSQLRLDLTPQEMAHIHEKVEGWITGLYLVSLSQRRGLAVAERLAITGRQRFIADYLSEDVLARLPQDTQRFLLQTSVLDTLCGSLVDSVRESANGQARLEELERESVFLVSLDDHREWFRYHHLFAEFLRGELARRMPDEVTTLHERAARWHLDHDMSEPAFRHALASGDAALVIAVLERSVSEKLLCGEVRALERWLAMIPPAWRETYPAINLVETNILLYTGHIEPGLRRLEQVERWARESNGEHSEQVGRVEALRCFMACHQADAEQAQAHADRALHSLGPDDVTLRFNVYTALGDSYRLSGRWREARESYEKGLDYTTTRVAHAQSAAAFGALADLDLRQGRLHAAHDKWLRALSVIGEPETWGVLPLPVSGWVHIRLGEILHEWNDLAQAEAHLALGMQRAELGGDARAMVAGALLAARLRLVAGDMAAAADHVAQAHRLIEHASFPSWEGQFERVRVECWLAAGKQRDAVTWASALLDDGSLAARAEREITWLAMARALSATTDTDALARARTLLDQALRVTHDEGRMGAHVDALALLALGWWRQGDHVAAMTTLERALRLAEPEGYVRLFADYGLPMARLLHEARRRGVMPGYVGGILEAFGASATGYVTVASTPPERLSDRECEVLLRLAAGLTNREIADALVISPETVKKHTSSIYAKLGVGNRTEAVTRARELDLLG
jgi:LuxR family maltose regulon positive regulatory protein